MKNGDKKKVKRKGNKNPNRKGRKDNKRIQTQIKSKKAQKN
jgi:hypothetical protein